VPANATRPIRAGPKADDRRRNQLIKIGLTALIVVSAVALVLYLVMSPGTGTKPVADKAKPVRVTSSHLVTKAGTTEPKVVLSLYEDPLCPQCGDFDKKFGPTVNELIDTGAVAADYYNVALLDTQSRDYSSRASAAAYCVADQSIDAFRRFHAALYAHQPEETAASFPDNAQLIEAARAAGVGGNVADCINSGKYTAMVLGFATTITGAPTIQINGDYYKLDPNSNPLALVDEVRLIVGDVPGLDVPAPVPPAAGGAKAVRVTSSHLVTKAGTTEPKAVLSLYDDPLCPACAYFDKKFGPTVNQLIDTGAVAADYYNVAILDAPEKQHYSSRASAAAYCVADQSIDAFRRFHAALYAQQPEETTASFPDNAHLIEAAREAGVGGNVADCINSGKYTAMVLGLDAAAMITATPTVRINGHDYDYDPNNPRALVDSNPRALVDKVRLIVGDVPGLDVPAPVPPS
jgi:protein-disulfide isomerase